MQQFPLSEPTFTMRAETPLTEWIVALPPATYSFRIKGKNGGVSGPYSDSLDNVVIGA